MTGNVKHAQKEKIYPAHVSKHNPNCEKQVILLMIPKREKRKTKSKGHEAMSEGRQWHYLSVKKTLSIIKRNNV